MYCRRGLKREFFDLLKEGGTLRHFVELTPPEMTGQGHTS